MSTNHTLNHICITDKKNCYGCTSCYAICPHKAIIMKEDERGFKYPLVDEKKCIDCGLCVKSCPKILGNQHKKTSSFFAVTHCNDEIRTSSSSGGVFSALAQDVIDRNGVVYGAVYDSDFNVKHIRADNEEWKKMRTSKYVQSDIGDNFENVKADLKSGRTVLFTGTPCQVDGLNRYLDNLDKSRLITCDLVCHGVPSPLIWRDYLELIRNETRNEIGKVNFRNKRDAGWHNSTLCIENSEGKVLINESHDKSLFSLLYFSHLILRPSCYFCEYSNLKRAGDISIGDYWGIEKYHPELDDNKGISLVLVNTGKGRTIIQDLEKKCAFTILCEDECMQPNLKAPAQDYGGTEAFWQTYKKYGLKFAGKRVGCIKADFGDKVRIFAVKVADKISSLFCKKRKPE